MFRVETDVKRAESFFGSILDVFIDECMPGKRLWDILLHTNGHVMFGML